MEKEIVWTQTALNQLKEIYFFLLEETKNLEIANNVINSINNEIGILKKLILKLIRLMVSSSNKLQLPSID